MDDETTPLTSLFSTDAEVVDSVASLAAASEKGEGLGGDLPAPDPKWAVCIAGIASSELLPYDEAEKALERRSELMEALWIGYSATCVRYRRLIA